jgi:heptosyltransferase-3
VKWLPEHPFFKQVKSGLFGLVDDAVAIPTTVLNIYDAIAFFGRSLGCSMNKRPKLYDLDGEPISAMPEQSVVGIHPFSSDSWRTWPAGLWARLVSELRNRLIKVRLFAASSEESKLQEIFGELVDNNWVTIDVGGIGSFFEALRRVTVLIGMDSFAVHSAYAIGIPTVMLNGSNDFRVWCPPNSRVINGGPACVYYPCFNRPRCRGSSSEFICFSSITVEQVLGAVEPFLRPE